MADGQGHEHIQNSDQVGKQPDHQTENVQSNLFNAAYSNDSKVASTADKTTVGDQNVASAAGGDKAAYPYDVANESLQVKAYYEGGPAAGMAYTENSMNTRLASLTDATGQNAAKEGMQASIDFFKGQTGASLGDHLNLNTK